MPKRTNPWNCYQMSSFYRNILLCFTLSRYVRITAIRFSAITHTRSVSTRNDIFVSVCKKMKILISSIAIISSHVILFLRSSIYCIETNKNKFGAYDAHAKPRLYRILSSSTIRFSVIPVIAHNMITKRTPPCSIQDNFKIVFPLLAYTQPSSKTNKKQYALRL